MQIIFNLPQVFGEGSDRAENSLVLKQLLDTLISINIVYLKNQQLAKRAVPPLYRSGVRYGRTIWWEPIPALYARRFGDCKSLTAALIAEYRLRGIPAEPVHRWITSPTGATFYHILVQTDKGFEDPSKVLGMGKDENAYFKE